MPGAQIHVQVVLPNQDGLAEDAVVNNWSFSGDGSDNRAAMATNAVARLATFYNAIHALYGSGVHLSANRFKVYDRADPAPRTPFSDTNEAITDTAASDSLPSEVAIVLSFSAAVPSGTIRARRRGRVYLGPFHNGIDTISTPGSRPSAGTRTTIKNAANTLAAANTVGTFWGVRSDMDDVTSAVVSGWVDDAWDTQRRRGLSPTARTVFP